MLLRSEPSIFRSTDENGWNVRTSERFIHFGSLDLIQPLSFAWASARAVRPFVWAVRFKLNGPRFSALS